MHARHKLCLLAEKALVTGDGTVLRVTDEEHPYCELDYGIEIPGVNSEPRVT